MSTFSKTLAMLFGLVVFGVQVCCCGSVHEEEQAMLMFHSVYGFARIQRYTDDKATAIREGNRSEVSGRRQRGLQAQLWVDLCIGLASVILKCIKKLRRSNGLNIGILAKAPTLCVYPSGAELLRDFIIHGSSLVNSDSRHDAYANSAPRHAIQNSLTAELVAFAPLRL